MFSHEELMIRRARAQKLRRLTKYAQQAVILSGTIMAYLGVLQRDDQGWFIAIAIMLAGCGFCFFSRWINAVGTAISDNYDLLEDIHHNLVKQTTDSNTEG